MTNPADFGIIGQLESVRQALEAAGEEGLSASEIRAIAGIKDRGSTQTFLMKLTAYCYVYEETRNRVTYFMLDAENDATFDRKLSLDDTPIFTMYDIEEDEWKTTMDE
jgi:hypothetical protein